jgi:orotate phosphoribosyltransferase
MGQAELIDLLAARRGHFLFESGHHGELGLDLDAFFLHPRPVARFSAELGRRLSGHGIDAVCGPLVGGTLVAQTIATELDVELYWTEPGERSDGLYSVEYRVPPAVRDRLRGRRVAIVDDVINAGSATRATFAELESCGATVVAIGALLILGSAVEGFAAEREVALEHVATLPNTLWEPEACPLCAAGEPLEDLRAA